MGFKIMIGYILTAMALDLTIQHNKRLKAANEQQSRHLAERRRVTAVLSRGGNPRQQKPLCSCKICTRYYV